MFFRIPNRIPFPIRNTHFGHVHLVQVWAHQMPNSESPGQDSSSYDGGRRPWKSRPNRVFRTDQRDPLDDCMRPLLHDPSDSVIPQKDRLIGCVLITRFLSSDHFWRAPKSVEKDANPRWAHIFTYLGAGRAVYRADNPGVENNANRLLAPSTRRHSPGNRSGWAIGGGRRRRAVRRCKKRTPRDSVTKQCEHQWDIRVTTGPLGAAFCRSPAIHPPSRIRGPRRRAVAVPLGAVVSDVPMAQRHPMGDGMR